MSINELTHQEFLKHSRASSFVKSTESTNLWAKQNFQGQFPFALFLADEQTQGRGRGNNSWTNSLPGHTLLSTWCLSLVSHPQPLFPLRVGLLLYEACAKTWPSLPWALKAPNDIYLGDEKRAGKWAGVLVEVVKTPLSVCAYIGIGANILSAPQKVDQQTTSLVDHTRLAENDWQAFCYSFYEGLLQIQKDPARTKLTNGELQSLQTALKKFAGNTIQTVLPDGSLELTSGETIHWSQL